VGGLPLLSSWARAFRLRDPFGSSTLQPSASLMTPARVQGALRSRLGLTGVALAALASPLPCLMSSLASTAGWRRGPRDGARSHSGRERGNLGCWACGWRARAQPVRAASLHRTVLGGIGIAVSVFALLGYLTLDTLYGFRSQFAPLPTTVGLFCVASGSFCAWERCPPPRAAPCGTLLVASDARFFFIVPLLLFGAYAE